MANKITETDSGVLFDDGGNQQFFQYAENKNLGSNFQYLTNPTTKKNIAIEKGNTALMQQLSNLGGYNPVSSPAVFSSDKAVQDFNKINNFANETEQGMQNQSANAQAKQEQAQKEAAQATTQATNITPPYGNDFENLTRWSREKPEDFKVWASANGWGKDDIQNKLSGGISQKEIGQQQIDNYIQMQKKWNDVSSGTFPLTADEQAQVDETNRHFNDLIEQQKVANKTYEGVIRVAGARSGTTQYAPETQSGKLKTAIDEGTQKIIGIESQARVAVANLKQAIKDKNYEAIKKSYDMANTFLADRSKAIQDQATATKQAIKDDLENKKTQLEVGKMTTEAIDRDVIPLFSQQLDEASTDEERMNIINEYKNAGYNTDLLQSRLRVYEPENIKQQNLNAKESMSILSQTATGGKIKIGNTEYTVLGKANDGNAQTITSQNGDVYERLFDTKTNSYTWKNTGIKAKDLTQENLINTYKTLTDMMSKGGADASQINSVIQNLAGSIGINLPTATGTIVIPQDVGNQKNQLAFRNNNPGNIKFIGQKGAVLGDGGFAKFETPEAGFDALKADLQHKISENPEQSLLDMIKIYAPLKDGNDPIGYARTVAEKLGITSQTKLKDVNINSLAEAMAYHESETTVNKAKTEQEITPFRPSNEEANKIDATTGKTNQAIYDAALRYATSGTMPPIASFGLNATEKAKLAKFKNDILSKSSAIMSAAGVDPTQLSQEYKSHGLALSGIVKQMTSVGAFEGQALKNADLALSLSDNVARTGSPIANKYKQWFDKEWTGNTDLTKFETAIYAFTKEYAKVVSGGAMSAAALTESASQEAQKLLNATMKPEQFKGAMEVMRTEMENRRQSLKEELTNISKGETPNLEQFYSYISTPQQELNIAEYKNQGLIQEVINDIKTDKLQGADGKISPKNFNRLKGVWSSLGADPKDFDMIFATYKNPNNTNY